MADENKSMEMISDALQAAFQDGYDAGVVDGMEISRNAAQKLRELPLFNMGGAISGALNGAFDGLTKAMDQLIRDNKTSRFEHLKNLADEAKKEEGK